MKGFDVLKVKSAVKARNKFDLSCSHLTTMDFGEIMPLLAQETIPADEFHIKGEYFSRMAPLVKPTYGKFQFKTIAGFVPYHQIADDAEAYLAGKTTFQGQTPHHRFFIAEDLQLFIYNYCVTTTNATVSNCDYAQKDASGNVSYYLFTKNGKRMVKILNALGYAIPQGVDLQSGSQWSLTDSKQVFSAYPLLAFCKLYNDYMSQSQRYNTSNLSDLLYRIKHGLAYSGFWTNTLGRLGSACINALLSNIRLNYENDYFTSAWQSPNSPLNTLESVSSVSAPNTYPSSVNANFNDNYVATTANSIGKRALDFLKSFDDWVRRNNYSGSREVQQIYSRFGIKTDDYRSNYAQVITTDTMPIQVGDVTSVADTQGAYLGDYAGKGIMNGAGDVNFKASDFGMLFILGYFTVTPMNAYGYDRSVLRSTPLDYYNPEFDGLGADPISVGEFFTSPIQFATNPSDTTQDTAVYGFTERYNSYRYGRDKITGEFRNYRANGDMNTWHTGRLLNDVRANGQLVAQNSAVNTLEQIDSQYNRIFSVTSGDVNHFYLTCRFSVDAIRPILNLNQVPNLGEGDTIVPRNGNVVS